MREDTRPETPLAKSSSEPPPASSSWRAPGSGLVSSHDDPFAEAHANGARFDWAFGSGKVRTFQATGPAGLALGIALLVVIAILISTFFVFAIGIGTAAALGAGAAGALGLGARAVRRRLANTQHRELGSGGR